MKGKILVICLIIVIWFNYGKIGELLKNTNTFNVAFVDSVNVTGVGIGKTEVDMAEGTVEKIPYKIYPTDATNKRVIWKSSNPSVATVDENGIVKAWNDGVAKVTVQSLDNSSKLATSTVKVGKAVKKTIKINGGDIEIKNGETRTLQAVITGGNEKVNWKSSNSKKVSVDQNGTIKGILPGKKAKITASLSSNPKIKASIVVYVSYKSEVYFLATQKKNGSDDLSNLSAVIKNSDKKLTVFDAASKGNCKFIVDKLKEISGNNSKPTIENLIISHSHADHVGCLSYLLDNTNVNHFYIKNIAGYETKVNMAKAKLDSSKIHLITKNMKIKFGDLVLKLFNGKNVYAGKEGKCNKTISILKFYRYNDTKADRYYKIDGKDVCVKGYFPENISYGNDCDKNEDYFALKDDDRDVCSDNANSLALLVKIPYFGKSGSGNRFAYLAGDLDNNGYPVYGLDHKSGTTVSKVYGSGVDCAIKVEKGKVKIDSTKNVKVMAETSAAKAVMKAVGNNTNKITIYQQSHHGFDNARDAINILGFNKDRESRHRLYSIATYFKSQKNVSDDFLHLSSYAKLYSSQNKIVMSSGEANDYVVCSIAPDGVTNCENK